MSDDWKGPRCPDCGSPCSLTFVDGSGIAAMYRYCEVCHGGKTDDFVLFLTVTVNAGTADRAKQAVIERLWGVGHITNIEAERRRPAEANE